MDLMSLVLSSPSLFSGHFFKAFASYKLWLTLELKKKQKQIFYSIKFQGFLEKGKGLYATENTTLEFY